MQICKKKKNKSVKKTDKCIDFCQPPKIFMQILTNYPNYYYFLLTGKLIKIINITHTRNIKQFTINCNLKISIYSRKIFCKQKINKLINLF